MSDKLCEGCPPVGHVTDRTRCDGCPRYQIGNNLAAACVRFTAAAGKIHDVAERLRAMKASDPAATIQRLTAELVEARAEVERLASDLAIIGFHDLVDFENPIEPGDAYRMINNWILLARAAPAPKP